MALAWNFGDGTTQAVGSVSSASHTYAAGGTYQVTLAVTDGDGGTASVTNGVSVLAANVAPVAAFTSSAAGLGVSVDGSGSTDADGAIAGWTWNFGDGGTATGATASHTYAAAGTYQVVLTVTDTRGGTASSTRTIGVSAPSAANVAADAFGRLVTAGWGSADLGGTWAVTGSASNYAATGAAATMTLAAAGSTTQAMLTTVRASNVDIAADVSVDAVANGGGVYFSLAGRRLNNNDYRAKVRVLSNGSVSISVTRVVGGVETTLSTQTVTGLTVAARDTLRMRLQIVGSGTSTLGAKVWKSGVAEPAGWLVTATDSTVALQSAGGVGAVGYLSGSSSNVPITVTFDNLTVGTPAA